MNTVSQTSEAPEITAAAATAPSETEAFQIKPSQTAKNHPHMLPPPIHQTSPANSQNGAPLVFASLAAGCAIIAVPFSFIPFAGLAGSALALGFTAGMAIWSRRKRAFVGVAAALLAAVISVISAFVSVEAMLASRNSANARLAQAQTELQAMKSQTAGASGKSDLGGVIKMFDTNNELTSDQANMLGKLGEWLFKETTSDKGGK